MDLGWTSYTTESAPFAKYFTRTVYAKCMDLSGVSGSVTYFRLYDTIWIHKYCLGLSGTYFYNESISKRTVLSDVNGVSWHGEESLTTLTYDLSAMEVNQMFT